MPDSDEFREGCIGGLLRLGCSCLCGPHRASCRCSLSISPDLAGTQPAFKFLWPSVKPAFQLRHMPPDIGQLFNMLPCFSLGRKTCGQKLLALGVQRRLHAHVARLQFAEAGAHRLHVRSVTLDAVNGIFAVRPDLLSRPLQLPLDLQTLELQAPQLDTSGLNMRGLGCSKLVCKGTALVVRKHQVLVLTSRRLPECLVLLVQLPLQCQCPPLH
mmetsp:Transcript_5718/g.17700  ORF Transcript_5718/g.17700 Transcript_5718/m.17700 type:complete len:214 (-) Transcript_5718:331-972(-)